MKIQTALRSTYSETRVGDERQKQRKKIMTVVVTNNFTETAIFFPSALVMRCKDHQDEKMRCSAFVKEK